MFTNPHACDACTRMRQEELKHASLPVNTVIESLRYGGVVSTGSHGTARDFGPMSDFVESMTIVDGRGQPVVYNASHPHFNQARPPLLRCPPRHECACADQAASWRKECLASPYPQGVRLLDSTVERACSS